MDQQEIIMKEFGRKQRRRFIAVAVTLAVLFGGAYGIVQWLGEKPALWFALLVFLGFLLFLWIDWRCPACDEHLGKEFHYTFCPHCGTRLSL